ncbi:MAG: hypothetical protein CBE00_12975 [Planctomycetaceae bacterium TMED240]|nr:MAG: hypothetical protein CBE00_12975 [Planctomycetaceae bacterium TMED240]
MSLPQTNLQLFQLMNERGFDTTCQQALHRAYGIAQQLFGTCFRPCGKPFVCHLIGTAAALAGWKQPIELINAGLLHSAYLFGDFQDGEKGSSPRRRRWLRNHMGSETEDLVYRYTLSTWGNSNNTQLHHQALADPSFCEVFKVKVADTYDELADYGILLSPNKHYPFGLLVDENEERALLSAIQDLISEEACSQFSSSLKHLRTGSVWPAWLRNERTSFYRVRPGIEDLRRGRINRRLVKLRSKIKPITKAA